ncbi:MAG: phenylalanine--tRNA ligase subunit alpha [Thiotrichales bacterium]|nr:MAG: phenylalanine--tRNA ligase subunit alpha [Thiotrichales bacterium]
MQNFNEIISNATSEVNNTSDTATLEAIRLQYLGKKGSVTKLLQELGKLPADQRAEHGQNINKAKQAIYTVLEQKKQELISRKLAKQLREEGIDVTLPQTGQECAGLHPISNTIKDISEFFTRIGFSIESGPEIDDEYHNFTALNIPDDHPARLSHDTFYLENQQLLLRTHTSGVQIRTMKTQKPPLRMISIGKVYRCDSDVTHTPMFHQMEALWIDDGITFGHLKAVLKNFLEYFFNTKINMRLRPSYFPFTEPSAEVDMSCVICNGKGCNVCSGTGWLEILGCGMVHPNVLKEASVDSNIYSGFAFGIGIDRLTMLRHGIDDIRLFFENDKRFLTQF